jgi:hypothetical protein
MKVEDEYLDVLHNIEAVVKTTYQENLELSDYDVDKAYAALITTYQNEMRGKSPIKPGGNLASLVYEQIASICDWHLGRASMLDKKGRKQFFIPEPLTTETMILCLKRLRKSVETWTKQGGRQGYLNYISHFL